MKRVKYLLALLLLLPICLFVGRAPKDAKKEALTRVIYLVYTTPNEEILNVYREPLPDDAPKQEIIGEGIISLNSEIYQSRILNIFGSYVSDDYLRKFFIDSAMMFQNMTDWVGGTILVKEITVTKNEGWYDYAVTLICRDAEGNETTVETSGTARFNEQNKIENFNPHGARDVLRAFGYI